MTRERYFMMCEQLGKEPDDEEIPPDWEDFPTIVIDAMSVFSMLGDRIMADIGFVGKDFTNLPLYMEIYSVEDKELFLEILTFLESRAREASQENMKKERDKLKRKK